MSAATITIQLPRALRRIGFRRGKDGTLALRPFTRRHVGRMIRNFRRFGPVAEKWEDA